MRYCILAGYLAFTVLCISALMESVSSADKVSNQGRPAPTRYEEDIIVFTANQGFLSRIYIMALDGSVMDYHEYTNYRFAGLQVIGREVYAAEAFAPRVYRVDLTTGDLDVVIDDWTLYYFYDVAFDGTYLYVDEWDMNRYDINGIKEGVAAFDEYVLGCAWDGHNLWTLDDLNLMKCWDLSTWPTVTEVPSNNFVPPSPQCRGLSYDGDFFWSAESIEDSLGYIYRFDHTGQVISQWLAPAYQGWGACVVWANQPPTAPGNPSPADGALQVPVDAILSWQCDDPDGDSLVFDVYLGASAPPELVSQGQREQSFVSSEPLDYETLYYWTIVAHDDQGDSTSGPLWSFTTTVGWICGDVNADGNGPNIVDLTYLVEYLFGSGDPPPIPEAADMDGPPYDSEINIVDLTYLVQYLFSGGPDPDCG